MRVVGESSCVSCKSPDLVVQLVLARHEEGLVLGLHLPQMVDSWHLPLPARGPRSGTALLGLLLRVDLLLVHHRQDVVQLHP